MRRGGNPEHIGIAMIPANQRPQNNNAHLPPGQPNNDQNRNGRITDEQYNDFRRLLGNFTSPLLFVIKLLVDVTTFTGDQVSLALTFMDNSTLESVGTGIFYFLPGFLIAFNFKKSDETTGKLKLAFKLLGNLILNIPVIEKPLGCLINVGIWWKLKKINNSLESATTLSKATIVSFAKVQVKKLKLARNDMFRNIFEESLMIFFQSYLLFDNQEKFPFGSLASLFRIATIGWKVFQIAKSVAEYETDKYQYEQTLHIAAVYESNGRLPMVIYSQVMLELVHVWNIIRLFLAIWARVFTGTFLLTVSPAMFVVYIGVAYLWKIFTLLMCPHQLLAVHENPPYGVATAASYLTKRFINIFASVGTHLDLVSEKSFKIFRIPALIILQILDHAIPLLFVYGILFIYDILFGKDASTLIIPSTNFASLREYSDIYGLLHFHWLFIFVQILFNFVYEFAVVMLKTVGGKAVAGQRQKYFRTTLPIMVGYAFYEPLIRAVTNSAQVQAVRKLMFLTVAKKGEFYGAFRENIIFMKKELSEDGYKTLCKQVGKRLKKLRLSDELERLQNEINALRNSLPSDQMFRVDLIKLGDFLMEQRNSQQKVIDLKLYGGFLDTFDKKIALLTSDRIERMSWAILGSTAVRERSEWEK